MLLRVNILRSLVLLVIDLRFFSRQEYWQGQSGVDSATGGPFAVFSARFWGWRAAAMCIRNCQLLHDIRTIGDLVHHWAPSSDHNDETQYAMLVAARAGYALDTVLDLTDADTVKRLMQAMAIEEGGADIVWPPDEIVEGMREASPPFAI